MERTYGVQKTPRTTSERLMTFNERSLPRRFVKMFTALQIGENFLGPTVPSAPAERLNGSLSTNDVTKFKNHKNHR